MDIELGLTKRTTDTKFAPLVALSAYYQQMNLLKPLESVNIAIKMREFSPVSKLQQVLLSILCGCEYLSEINTRLKPEQGFAQVWQWRSIADQSTLSRTLDELSLINLTQLGEAVNTIWRLRSATVAHDWRGFLWLDFDLTGLPCGPQAEASQKGYFSEKKHHWAAVSTRECRQLSRNDLVGVVSRQPSHRHLPPTSGGGE
jgi:hypothetical protein